MEKVLHRFFYNLMVFVVGITAEPMKILCGRLPLIFPIIREMPAKDFMLPALAVLGRPPSLVSAGCLCIKTEVSVLHLLGFLHDGKSFSFAFIGKEVY